jgi:20S proteasome alpha/beta subunit
MTLVVGFQCVDGVVIAGEMEEAAGFTAKRTIGKLIHLLADKWSVVIGGAGDSAIIDNGIDATTEQLRPLFGKTINSGDLSTVLDTVLADLHTKYIDPDPKSDGVSFVIGAICGHEKFLFSTQKRAPQPQREFACVGFGADLAIYFCDRLHNPWGSTEDAAKLAAVILKESKEATQYCGQGSNMYVLNVHSGWKHCGSTCMEQLERELPDVGTALSEYLAKLRISKPSAWRNSEDRP